MDYAKEIAKFPQLIEDLETEQLCIFVGAGISRMSNLPLWADLVRPLAEEIGVEYDDNPIDIAQYYVNSRTQGRFLLNKRLEQALNPADGAKPSIAHSLIAELPVKYIFTTNYDTLLEKAYKKAYGATYQVLLSNEDLPYFEPRKGTSIVKLNGCLTKRETIVITREDYEKHADSREGIINLLKTLMATSSMLFLGTSFTDPAFDAIYAQVLHQLPSDRRPFYILTVNFSKHKIEDLKKRGFEVVNIEADTDDVNVEVTKFLETLLHSVKKREFSKGDSTGSSLISSLNNPIHSRFGTILSTYDYPDYVDRVHKYQLLYRQDLLDYKKGDFYSIRRIRGINISDHMTSGLPYVECSEQKIRFLDTQIKAFDTVTQEPLLVSPKLDENKFEFSHAFRVMFPKPIQHGEAFDLVYCITLPGELNVLEKRDEIMSISLKRVKHPIDVLQFNVCLNFKPRSIDVGALAKDNQLLPCSGEPPIVEEYNPSSWYEKDLDIAWKDKPYRIVWNCEKPSSELYVIHYYS